MRAAIGNMVSPEQRSTAYGIFNTTYGIFWFLGSQEIADLRARRVPVVALSPLANRTTGHADVILPTAMAGLEVAETAYRMDGLPLALPALLPTALPSDREVLEMLAAALDHRPRWA